MPSPGQEISRGRSLVAAAALLACGGIVAKEAIHGWGVEWLLLAFAGIVAAAGVGITRRSLVVQIVSRAAAWTVLAPTLLVTILRLFSAQVPPIGVMALALGAGAALLLARPMLHTDAAKRSFEPKAFRSLLLSGSTATAATGFVAGGIALDAGSHWWWSHPFGAAGLVSLAAALFASAIGVVRMRAWGILLGAFTSVALLACAELGFAAAFFSQAEAVALMLAAMPPLLLHALPVLLARWGAAPNRSVVRDAEPRARVDVSVRPLASPDFVTAHLRVAADDAALDDAALDDDAPDDAALDALQRPASMRA